MKIPKNKFDNKQDEIILHLSKKSELFYLIYIIVANSTGYIVKIQ